MNKSPTLNFETNLKYFMVGLIVVSLIFQLLFIFTTDINWDEFYFLSHVYDYQRGDLGKVLQTIHVHFFGWLNLVSINEVTQIITARLLMFALSLATLFFIYQISCRYTSGLAATFGVAGYCMFSFVADHSASFRADPIATFLLMAAIYIVVFYQWNLVLFGIAGVLIGLAGLVTIKSAFIAPVVGLIMLFSMLQSANRKQAFVASCFAVLCAIASFGSLYLWHKSTFPAQLETASIEMLSSSIEKTLLGKSIFPQSAILLHAMSANFTISLALVAGLFYTIRGFFSSIRGQGVQAQWLLLASFGLPLITLTFYRNTFPYYYSFMLAPVSILLAVAAHRFFAASLIKPEHKRIIVILLALMVMQFGLNAWKNFQRTSQTQFATLDVIHRAFPEPVNYIDRSSMVASFSKQGFFMSSWGFESYFIDGKPLMRDILEREQPRFLIANIAALDVFGKDFVFEPKVSISLLKDDIRILRDHYIHHWGKIYVAGKQFFGLKQGTQIKFEILIEGEYSLESEAPVILDGNSIQPGGQVFLNQGSHTMLATKSRNELTLRWGKNLYKPDFPAPSAPIFFGF